MTTLVLGLRPRARAAWRLRPPRRRTGWGRPPVEPWAGGGGGPAVALTGLPGTPTAALGAAVAAAARLPLLDGAMPAHVAAELGVDLAEAEAMDGVAPSRLAHALAASPLLWPAPEIDGALAALHAVDRFGDATRLVIERAARQTAGAVVVGRGATAVLRHQPGAVLVLVTAPAWWRAEALAADGEADRRRADRAFHRYHRDAHGVDASDPAGYDLVLDASAEDVATMARITVAELHRSARGA